MASIAMAIILAVFAVSMLVAFAMNRQRPAVVDRGRRYDGGFGSGGDATRNAR